MWSVINRVGQLLGLVDSDPIVDEKEIAAVLDAEHPIDDEEQETNTTVDIENDGVRCQHRVGVITELYENQGYIKSEETEGKKSQLVFNRKDCLADLKVGSKVVYLVYRTSEEDEWKVRKILTVLTEFWDPKKTEDEEVTLDEPAVLEECETAYKHVIAKVTGRQGRTVLADPLQFCLDSVQIDFIPVEGDWLVLESLVQTEKSADTVLAVDRVKALRSQTVYGTVTHWNEDVQKGIVDGAVVFDKDICEPGYLPRVGDQVTVNSIESEQGALTWRAVSVLPTASKGADISHDPKALTVMLQNKQGITLSEDTNCGAIKIGQEKEIQIHVKNESSTVHTLLDVELVSQESQFRLVSPACVDSLEISPQTSVTFTFQVKGRFEGRSTELVVFHFEGFDVGRQLAVDVQSAWVVNSLSSLRGKSVKNTATTPLTAEKLLSTRNGFILSGVKPIMPCKFIPVALPFFRIPDKFVNLVLGSGQSSRLEDLLGRLLNDHSSRCLGEPLSEKNYTTRWDLLIHLEELEHKVNISRYDTHASLHRIQDFLSMEIPGLSERRPSLIVGDKVIARESWNDENSWATGAKQMAYEGYIHKVLGNEIHLKFHPTFHDSCSGVYNVSFEGGRTGFQRQHQAVHLAKSNLTYDWLFPSRVTYSDPQIVIVEEEDHGSPSVKPNKDKNSKNSLTEKTNENVQSKDISIKPDDNKAESQSNEVSGEERVDNIAVHTKDNCVPDISPPKKMSLRERLKVKVQEMEEQPDNDAESSFENCDNVNTHVSVQSKEPSATNQSKENGRRRGCKLSVLDKIPKEKTQLKASPPRVPVINRFLDSKSCPSAEKSPKEVKNMLRQLASLSNLENVSGAANHGMKTLEEIEKSMLNGCSDIANDVKPLSENNKLSSQEKSENSAFQEFLNASNVVNDRKENFKSECVPKEKKSVLNNSSEKRDKLKMENPRKTTENNEAKSFIDLFNKKDEINWNSKIGMKIGDVKEADNKMSTLKRRKLTWFNPLLNRYQKEAVRNILRGDARPLPYVIFGPPGTGKTITLVETILQTYFLIPESRILVGTPSNSAADLICERLLDWQVLAPGDLLRLAGFHYADRVPDRLRPYCGTPDMKARDDYRDTRRPSEGVVNISRHAIGRHRITVGTCGTLGRLYEMGFPKGHFTHVMVDEAGQATEPEILIPLVFLHTSYGQSVLAGDPLQLGPVVLSKAADHLGLGESLLSRLLKHTPYRRDNVGFCDTGGYNPHLVTKLVYNYRSLPEILALPNNMFYDGDLLPQVSQSESEEARVLASLQSVLPPGRALVFHGVRGTNCQAEDSPSWHNPHEAVQATRYLQALYRTGLTPDDCGIITPYQAQAMKIRQLLETLDIPAPKVGSVEEFQGQERSVIILSTVRSSPRLIESDLRHTVGFVASPRRLNVAITRARAALVIVGNPHLLARDKYWRTVLAYCVSRGGYTGCDRPDLETSQLAVNAK